MGMVVTFADKRLLVSMTASVKSLAIPGKNCSSQSSMIILHSDESKSAHAIRCNLFRGKSDYYTADRLIRRKRWENFLRQHVFVHCLFELRMEKLPGILTLFDDLRNIKMPSRRWQKEHRTLKHLLQSSDHERQLIAYEIHDGLAQQLAGAIMQFQTLSTLKKRSQRKRRKPMMQG